MNRHAALAWWTLMLVLAMTGCALGPPHLPDQIGQGQLAAGQDNATDRLVVTVRNVPATLNPHAASTPRGYTGQGAYRAGAAALAAARRIEATHGLRELASWPIELLGVHCLVYEIPAGTGREQALAALQRDPDVESAQRLTRFELRTTTYNDPYAFLQTNLDRMDVASAQQLSRGDGVRIAVIDTGVDTGHPDFGGRLVEARDVVADGRSAAERHGTAVAGIIGAVPNNRIGIAGIAPGATLISLRACWSTGDGAGACNTFTLAQALAAAVDVRAAVINLSLGGPADALLTRIVERALARGTVVIGAVPRSGRREGFPSGVDGVIAVDAAGGAGAVPQVLYAPGADIFTLAPQGRYDAASGSSVAAAEVSGVTALLLARRPRLSGREIESALGRSGAANGSPGQRHTSVNACVALRELQPAMRCLATDGAVAVSP